MISHQELEVQHPAAKMIVLASQQQEVECGDGTNFVMILAGKLFLFQFSQITQSSSSSHQAVCLFVVNF